MKASDLRGILTYIPSFRDKLFVLSVDSAVLEDERAASLFLDISVLRSLNIRVALVHGASARIKKVATEMKVKPSDVDGLGVTDEATLRVAERAANSYSHDILQHLADVDLKGAVTNAVIAHPAGILGGVDHQWTGRVERVDSKFLEALLDNGIIPVIPPLGVDGDGRTYRVNSDGVALEVAEALRAEKLIFLTGNGDLPKNGKKPAQLSVEEATEYLKKKKGEISQEMASKLEHGLRACKEGVSRAHILDGREDEALLDELFSSEGVGTMIYADEYTEIRKALKKDVRSIMRLIGNSVAAEELLRRTRAQVAADIGDYSVFEIDGNMVGCVAATPAFLHAQTTNYSQVVGYTTTTVKGHGGAASSWFSFLPIQMLKPSVFIGVGSASGTTVTLTGASYEQVGLFHFLLFLLLQTGCNRFRSKSRGNFCLA